MPPSDRSHSVMLVALLNSHHRGHNHSKAFPQYVGRKVSDPNITLDIGGKFGAKIGNRFCVVNQELMLYFFNRPRPYVPVHLSLQVRQLFTDPSAIVIEGYSKGYKGREVFFRVIQKRIN